MSFAIITAIRKSSQLHGSLFHTAKELAHRASGDSGVVTISYSYLASKCHQSKRTTIRHIAKLVALGIIRCQRFWQAGRKWLCNRYTFTIAWERPKPAQMSNSDIPSSNLPRANSSEKYGSLENEQKGKSRILGWLTEGSELWNILATHDEA